MKKTLLLISALTISATAFAQLAPAGQSFNAFKEGDAKVGRAVASAVSAAKATQTAGQVAGKAASVKEYTLGSKFDLADLGAATATLRIAPAAGKTFKVAKATDVFKITYSKYSYKFNLFAEEDGSLLIKITPVEQNETLWPTADVRFEVHGNQLIAAYHAVTMDDVNSGLGWGESSTVATVEDSYKLGSKIDLAALNGLPTTVRIAPVTGKAFKLDKTSSVFNVTYSRYSYKFDYSVEQNGALAVKITPVEQKENLWPTATVRFEIHGNVLSSVCNAITIDDVNNGQGWGVVEDVALLK